jgi:hypothetical protein
MWSGGGWARGVAKACPRRLMSALVRVLWASIWMGVVGGLAAAAHAQSATDGAIAGQVTTSSGHALDGAIVVARGVDTGLQMAIRTNANGEFMLVRLPVGAYALAVEYAGVWLEDATPVIVRLGEVTGVMERMRQPLLGTPVNGGDLSVRPAAELNDLPVDGGQWRSLSLASSGANGAAGSDGSAGEVSYRGVATAQNVNKIDGASGDQSFSGGATGSGVDEEIDTGADGEPHRDDGMAPGQSGGKRAGASYTFAQAAVREFQLHGQGDAASYGSALYGHGVGGVVTSVSKRGEQTLHGMGFYTIRDSAWAATNPFSIATSYANGVVTSGLVKPEDLRQQYGGSVGGPLPSSAVRALPGRLFYFYAFDQQRRNFPAISSPEDAAFYQLTATQTALLGNRGVAGTKINAALNYLDSLTGTVARESDQTINFARLDWQVGGAERVVAEFNRARWSGPGAARTGAVVNRGLASLGSSYGAVDSGVARWVAFLANRLSNELRLEYGRELQYEEDQTPLTQEPAIGPGGLPPEVSIGPNGIVYGTPAGLGQKAYPDERRIGVADVLAWVSGRQLLQMGVDFATVRDFIDSLANVEGTFTYDSGATGGKAGGLVDWITDYTFNVNAYPNGGCPSIVAAVHDFCYRSYSQSFGQQSVTFNTRHWAGFVQDDWPLRNGLTVHAGVRYEMDLLPAPQQPNATLDAVFGGVGVTSLFPEDRNNFGPRLGVVWEPQGEKGGVLRVGYGAYFGKLPGATIRAALLDTAMPTSTTSVRVLPTTETLCPQNSQVGFGYACSYLAVPTGVVAATTSAMVFDHRFRLPAVQQGTISFERDIGLGVRAKVGYVMNLDRQLPDSVDINIAPSAGVGIFQLQGGDRAIGVQGGETFVMPMYRARVSTNFGPVTDILSNSNATYNGLTVEAARGLGSHARFGKGLEFRVGWTWSKALDYGQNNGAVPRTNGQTDPFTVRYDKGLSALDFPHKIVATAMWTPQIPGLLAGMSERWIGGLANGWSITGIFSESSGHGYTYNIFGGTRLTGGHESINGSGGLVDLPTVGRNTLRLPDTSNLNLRASRTIRLPWVAEGFRMKLTADAFNVLNHQNVYGVTQRAFLVGAPVAGVTPLIFQDAATIASEGLNVLPFGAYTAAGTSQARERQVQLGVRVEF